MSRFLTKVLDLSISPFSSVNFVLCFVAILLSVYKFRIVMSFCALALLSLLNVPLYHKVSFACYQ